MVHSWEATAGENGHGYSNTGCQVNSADNVQGAPDLVVEVLSPSTADRTVKRSLYARHGVQEYGLVDIDAKTVTVLQRNPHGFAEIGVCSEGQSLASPTLTGFAIASDEIC